MKTLITASLALLFLSTATLAQRYHNESRNFGPPMADKGSFEIGAGFGLNLSQVSYDNGNGYNSNYNDGIGYRTGLNVAVSGEYYFSSSWGIKAKIIYDPKGWHDDYYHDTYRLNYVTIPIMASWHFGRTKNWYLNFGPYIGFLTNATQASDGTDIKSSFNSTDGGLALGIGVKIPINDKVKFFIEDQAQAGISNIFTGSAAVNNPTTVNSSSGLNVGVVFTLSGK